MVGARRQLRALPTQPQSLSHAHHNPWSTLMRVAPAAHGAPRPSHLAPYAHAHTPVEPTGATDTAHTVRPRYGAHTTSGDLPPLAAQLAHAHGER